MSNLVTIPEGLRGLGALQILTLDGSRFASLPENSLRGLNSLRRLSLRGCRSLLALPESITCLSGLLILRLGGCALLSALPARLGALVSLQRLCLDECFRLGGLPESLHELAALTSLEMLGGAGLPEQLEVVADLVGLRCLGRGLGWERKRPSAGPASGMLVLAHATRAVAPGREVFFAPRRPWKHGCAPLADRDQCPISRGTSTPGPKSRSLWNLSIDVPKVEIPKPFISVLRYGEFFNKIPNPFSFKT